MPLDKDTWLMKPKPAGKMPSGRTIFIIRETGAFTFKIEGGGRLPRALTGAYTRLSMAQSVVDEYVAGLDPQKEEE